MANIMYKRLGVPTGMIITNQQIIPAVDKEWTQEWPLHSCIPATSD